MAVHIGEAIQTRLLEVGMPKSTFAQRIGRHRGRIYDVLDAPSCDTALLRKISQVLECNFFKMLSEDFEPTSVVSEPAATYVRQPVRPPMRIVIEVDQDNVAAKAEAERMAARIMEKSMQTPGPARDKAPRKVRPTPSRKPR